MVLRKLRVRKIRDYLIRSLQGPIPYDDPELVAYIRHKLLIPPSAAPYNLLGKSNTALIKPEASERFYKNITKHLFGDMKGGIFIEAGALDGESMSNTLRLETHQGWSGLLVEADSVSFEKLLAKNRKSWSLNACLSPYPYPSQEMLSSHSHYTGPNVLTAGLKVRAMHSLLAYMKRSAVTGSWYKKVQCLPLTSVLTALNITHVDLWVLDVEGAEMDILRSFDFKKFIVDVIYMEWKARPEHRTVAKEVEDFGYRLIAREFEDLVLVRKGTVYDPGVSYIIPEVNVSLTAEQQETVKIFAEKGMAVQF
ncbi:hypothetical protein HAZT_HAZT007910 [Hyalella azteca]|uniref:Methyltransferase FkbM domain-containing protein n=1 Tax=Hyalella azteca TaxID=294128 RepID=A0A6A0GZ26_HYAAZ|nr:hypothetical protein HAZT_HAZT007910 [Hyalella azteca]